MKRIFVCICISFSLLLIHAAGKASPEETIYKPYWQDPAVVAVHKEAPRTAFMTYTDRPSALSAHYENTDRYASLNGVWKFYFVDAYGKLPYNVADPSFPADDWTDITVPGNLEVQGHGVAIYTNHGYEFKPRNPQPPLLPEENPVGVYRSDV